MAPLRKASSHLRPDGVGENFRISSYPKRNFSPEKGWDAPGLPPPSPPHCPRPRPCSRYDCGARSVSLSLQSSGKSQKLDRGRPLPLLQPRQLFLHLGLEKASLGLLLLNPACFN